MVFFTEDARGAKESTGILMVVELFYITIMPKTPYRQVPFKISFRGHSGTWMI